MAIKTIAIGLAGALTMGLTFATNIRPGTNDGRRPNVLVVMADQWRFQAIGHHGDPNVQTPHIDRLCKEGVDFVNAVAEIPVCTPSRASFMTGQLPLRNGVFMNDVQLDTNALTVAEVFRNAGYATACIGKWHVDGRGRTAFTPPGGRRQGFDYWKVLECTHRYNHSLYYADTPDMLVWEGYDAFAQTADAIQYMDARLADGKPFFMFLSWGPPHAPYHTAPAAYRKLYTASDIQLTPNVPEHHQAQAREALAGYYAHCTALDSRIGQLMDYLQDSGLDSNTIVLFLSDHGDLLGSYGETNKQQPYDESIRIPMVFKLPGIYGAETGRREAPVGVSDVMPTLLGLCGLGIPEAVDGRDYSSYLLGLAPSAPDTAKIITCVQPFGQWSRAEGGKEFRGLRTERYTYVRDLSGPWLFFDNVADPYQQRNLLDDPNYLGLIGELDRLLQARLTANGDHFLPGLEYVKKYSYPPLDGTETVLNK